MVELNNEKQATGLLTYAHIADLVIRVTPRRSLNRSQGVVISEADLVNEKGGDLLKGLKVQGIT